MGSRVCRWNCRYVRTLPSTASIPSRSSRTVCLQMTGASFMPCSITAGNEAYERAEVCVGGHGLQWHPG